MKTSNFKKALSLLLVVLVLFSAVPMTVFSTDESYPVMKAYATAAAMNTEDYHASSYKSKVVTVTFMDKIDTTGAIQSWDVSASSDTGTVIAWIKLNEAETEAADADRYDVYIGGEGGVGANENSSNVFFNFINLKEVNGLENFKTGNATTLDCFFEKCKSLKTVDLSSFDTSNVTNLNSFLMDCNALESVNFANWDTSKVTNMGFMFTNCWVLPILDISSFNTKNVTNMKRMFYKCQLLTTLYTGDDWSVEQVIDSGEMFNCCYVIEGKIPFNQFYTDKTYATTEGYLTYKESNKPTEYTVTYEFIGEAVPEGVTAPEAFNYNSGSTIKVADAPTADGYVFSGWATEDTTVAENGEFTVNNDVHFVGSWSKLYTVTYKYAEGYEIPEGAPALTSYTFKAGDAVTVDSLPFVDGYTFVGWTTEDVTVKDNKFAMPENDVTLYGFFKKPVDSVEINGEELVMNEGDETKINVTVKPEDATIKDLVYESSDESVVKVDENGNITALKEGTATITVSSVDDPTKSDTITITVKVPVKEIVTDKDDITIDTGDTDKITVTVNPDGATNKNVEFSSSDESIVTVDKDGNITALKEGTATITITSEDDPTVTKTVTVTVENPVTDITASEDFTMDIGDIKNVDAKVNEDATNKKLNYESSDPGIAKVDSNGEVIALKEGTVTIIISSEDDPSITETVTVTVKTPVSDIVIPDSDITLDVNEEAEIGATVAPDEADYGLTYESSDPTIAEVDENGKITAKKEGEVTVTVKSEDGRVEKTIKVTVTKPDVLPESITVNKNEFDLEEGDSDKITVTVNPDDTTDKTVDFTSSDESVVKVDEEGNITAVGEGTATITVTSKVDPDVKTEIKVTVTKPATDEPGYVIDVTKEMSLVVGQKKNIAITITPDDGKLNPTFTSADESIAKVDANGNITALRPGITTVTVDFGNGDIRVIPVTVIAVPTPPRKHHVCFGKTDGIGWYEVSVNGGDFFPQGPNSTLEVDEGSVLVVRVQDMWIDDEFDFYVNGKKVPLDPANTITVVVDGYMLIGALSMDVEVPDVEESLTLFEKIIKAIKDFFEMLFGWMK